MSALPHLRYVPGLGIPSAPYSGGAGGCFPRGLEEREQTWEDTAAERAMLPPECGQDEFSVNNHKSGKRFSLLGLPLQRLVVIDEATGTCQSSCS